MDPSHFPRHIAVIMDGNGRWAKQRGRPRLEGHRAGFTSVRQTVKACSDLGIRFLTLYAFSTENWRRPTAEVQALMLLIEHTLSSQLDELHSEQVRVRHLGMRDGLPDPLLAQLDRAADLTAGNTGLVLHLAVNYGGRQEILAAVAKLLDAAARQAALPRIDEDTFRGYLCRPDLPDVDLLVRSGGDYRISNYLLWQIAYAEIYVTPVLWPDFRRLHMLQALLAYQSRQRRFGGVDAADPSLSPGVPNAT